MPGHYQGDAWKASSGGCWKAANTREIEGFRSVEGCLEILVCIPAAVGTPVGTPVPFYACLRLS